MRISKFGHSCLLVEEGEARLLIDPGEFSDGFSGLTGLSAVLITHQHADHLVPDIIAALAKTNPGLRLLADAGSAAILAEDGRVQAQVVTAGAAIEVAGVAIRVLGQEHAQVHPRIPVIPNVGYLVADKFFYPGDNFTEPKQAVEVLALPLGAPWLKVSEVVDYVMQVKPKVAIPVHDAVLAMPQMHQAIVGRLTAEVGIELRVVANGASTNV